MFIVLNMKHKSTIGKLIENEVRRQQLSVTEFAKMICCQRNNVYDIFNRSSMDIVQLKLISKVLKHNFFKELYEDIELIDDSTESEEDIEKKKAVSQFFNAVPDALNKLKKSSAIVFCNLDDPENSDCPTPDFGLSDYFITFTVGNTLKERIGNCTTLPITSTSDGNGCTVEICSNTVYNSVLVNIKLDYKTSDEWYRILDFAFKTYDSLIHK